MIRVCTRVSVHNLSTLRVCVTVWFAHVNKCVFPVPLSRVWSCAKCFKVSRTASLSNLAKTFMKLWKHDVPRCLSTPQSYKQACQRAAGELRKKWIPGICVSKFGVRVDIYHTLHVTASMPVCIMTQWWYGRRHGLVRVRGTSDCTRTQRGPYNSGPWRSPDGL
jgi:hypothetical protein